MTYNTFCNSLIPYVVTQIHDKLDAELRGAHFVHLITDCWSSYLSISFLALGAVIVKEDFSRVTRIIGMVRITGSQNAEALKEAIEMTINTFGFNKNKLASIVCDEGKNLLRLFKPIDGDGFFYDVTDEDEEEDEKEEEDENDDIEDNDDYVEVLESEEDEGGSPEDEDETSELIQQQQQRTSPEQTHEDDIILLIPDCIGFDILAPKPSIPINVRDDDNDEYNFSYDSLIKDLELQIGSCQIPRYQCMAHKLNVSSRKSIRDCDFVSDILTKLSNFASTIKKTLILSALHRENKCKIHRQNFTRWSSSFTMLLTMLKSYKKNLFNDTHKCPVSQTIIEKVLRILLPLYLVTNEIQSDNSSISIVIPTLLILLHENLNRMVFEEEDEHLNDFRDYLVYYINQKFDHELNSNVYQVAALLNVGKLSGWRDRSFGRPYYNTAKSALYDVVNMFSKHTVAPDTETPFSAEPDVQLIAPYDAINHGGLSSLARMVKSTSKYQDLARSTLDGELRAEVDLFNEHLRNTKFTSTSEFWKKYKNEMPHLFNLALRLLTIPATSAFLERFFSYAGIYCNNRTPNLSDETLINRSLIRSNMCLLEAK